MKRAVIVGVHGQDGQLLYDLLLKRRYLIVGIDRNRVRCSPGIFSKQVDVRNYAEVANLIKKFQPQEVYYLAAYHQSSEDLPIKNVELLRHSYEVHVAGLANFLEAIKSFWPKARLFYAASSHIFGETKKKIHNENTPINPNCIYGITKAAGLALCRFYRFRYGVSAVAGILYNHESTLRSERFVSKKIIKGAVNIKRGKQNELVLGDLRAVIDWGYAPDYVRAMHSILNNKSPDDFIIATGKRHTVLDFVKVAFGYLGLDWKSYVKENYHIVRKHNFCRVGNPAKLKRKTGWKPSVDFKKMVKLLLTQEGAFDEAK
jgi:GDPmannose 4,6-dehydratase